MVKVSNRLIISLLLVAISIAALGTIVGLNSLVGLSDGGPWLSGAATTTATGDVNLSITAVTSLTNQRAIIDFLAGYVNASCNFCQMDSNGVSTNLYSNGTNISATATDTPPANCCVGWNSSGQTMGFLLENTGNTNLSVGYTCTGNCSFPLFIDGTRSPGMGGLEIKVTSNSVAAQGGETGTLDSSLSCIGGGTLYNITFGTAAWNITNNTAWGSNNNVSGRTGAGLGEAVYVPLSSTGHWLCGNQSSFPLSSVNANDAAVVDINITIPGTAPAAVAKTFQLTFNGTNSQ